eukprot:TRINITY_DN2786_c0_g1_i2.p1 TRINITY_DN2786_c0_g1~~TRINITY_DN2786_c0_g1_i2.p1  ORF type:complete len:382 (+),score=106.20 TRINITY_DN2786_c0_g1_i2:99-1244(+)
MAVIAVNQSTPMVAKRGNKRVLRSAAVCALAAAGAYSAASAFTAPLVAPGPGSKGLAGLKTEQLTRSNKALTAAAAGSSSEPSGANAYFTGISWYLMHFFIGITNDGIMKFLGAGMQPAQIVFMRFTSAAVVLLPILLTSGSDAFKTARLSMHAYRGALLAVGIGLWCMGLGMMPFASCVVINNTMPFFKMSFAALILGEKVGKERWIASLAGFLGCLIVFNPTAATFQPMSMVLLLSAMCFAMLDILNKKYAVEESIVSMLFYGSISTALVSAFRAWQVWVPMDMTQYLAFGALGVGANLLLFCLLKAFKYVDASATCPYRYTEFVIAACAGFFLFGEKPSMATLLGSCIIVPSVIYCAMVETKEANKAAEAQKLEPAAA